MLEIDCHLDLLSPKSPCRERPSDGLETYPRINGLFDIVLDESLMQDDLFSACFSAHAD